MLAPRTPAVHSPIVTARRRRGVNQPPKRTTSHARRPVADAPAIIAPAMQFMHMP